MADEKQQRPHLQFKVNKIPTIKVTRKEDQVECIINESDFDGEIYTQQRVAPRKAAPAKKAAPKPEEKSTG